MLIEEVEVKFCSFNFSNNFNHHNYNLKELKKNFFEHELKLVEIIIRNKIG